jgi:hypothetical protein
MASRVTAYRKKKASSRALKKKRSAARRKSRALSRSRRPRRRALSGGDEEGELGASVEPQVDGAGGGGAPQPPPEPQQHLPLNEVFSKLMSIGVAAKNIKPVSAELQRMVKAGEIGPEMAPQLVSAMRTQFGL